MKPLTPYFKAFAQEFTYNVRRNSFLWLGFFTGLIVTLLQIALGTALLGTSGTDVFELLREQPIYVAALAQPLFFALMFGAIGTLRRDLRLENDALIRNLTGLAMTDPLTGLYNRRYVTEELTKLLLRSGRSAEPVTVVYFDLDHFKAVNSKQGHRGGDLMLKQVAEALRSVLRRGETLARYGGDEFVLVIPGDLPYARGLVDRAVDAVRTWTRLSLSAGIAMAPLDGETPESLIAAADASLAETKRNNHEEQRLVRP